MGEVIHSYDFFIAPQITFVIVYISWWCSFLRESELNSFKMEQAVLSYFTAE